MDETTEDYRTVAKDCWDLLSLGDDPELTPEDFAAARESLDPYGWLPWDDIKRVLCLAAGGGEQGPLYASLGYDVTLADISPGQLARDQEMAAEHGLELECVEADMMDLHELYGRDFDLVYQGISAFYVPDVTEVYRQVARVVRPGGLYMVDHWLPTHVQLADDEPWDGSAYRLDKPLFSDEPVLWRQQEAPIGDQGVFCWHYLHPLGRLLGGLCESGFVIEGVGEPGPGDLDAEPGTDEHLYAYLPGFLTVLARRRG